MAYTDPKTVLSPKKKWQLYEVLYNGGEDQWSLAKGEWLEDGHRSDVIAIRWNGNDYHHKGNPVSRGYPTWFILPQELTSAVLSVIQKL
jgi:hypothetical protein